MVGIFYMHTIRPLLNSIVPTGRPRPVQTRRAYSSLSMHDISIRSLYAFISLCLYTAATVARALAATMHALNLIRIISLHATRPPTRPPATTAHPPTPTHAQRARSIRPISNRFRGEEKVLLDASILQLSFFHLHL